MRNKRFLVWILLTLTTFLIASCATENTVPPTRVPPTAVPPTATSASGGTPIQEVDFALGRGYIKDWWAVYFNEPSGSSNADTYVDGIDVALANVIDNVRNTLDIVAFEMNNEVIVDAIIRAHDRGVTVRMVTDDEHGLEDRDEVVLALKEYGIPIVDDSRSALMHDKFMIMDSTTVWTGSWNYTVNDTYRNNNNALVMRSQRAVQAYQAEFDEMFVRKEFGPTSTDDGMVQFRQDGTDVSILFASEGNVIEAVADAVRGAKSNIRFMTFVFSSDSLGEAMLEIAENPNITIQGVFENRNSTADWSMLPPLYCAGIPVRQDGNRYVLHHKVVIVDDDTVVTGSFNFSGNASRSNDENLVIIKNKDIAQLYIDEWQRMWDQAEDLEDGEVTCD